MATSGDRGASPASSPAGLKALSVAEMVPAPGQGALAVQARADGPARAAVAAIEDPVSRVAFDAERRVVALLGGGCALPLGVFAEAAGDVGAVVRMVAVVLRPD